MHLVIKGNKTINFMETKMRNAAISLVLVVCMTGVSFAQEEAEGSAFSFDVSADFFSKYVWRGIVVTDDWVFQPGASFTYGGLTAGVWGNVDMTDENGEEWEFIEYDYYVDYSGNLTDSLSYSLGYIYYKFPGLEDTYEFYGGLSYDTILSPSITWYYDADAVEGSYVAFGLGHSVDEIAKLSDDISMGMDIGLNIGWGDSDYNDAYWSGADAGDGFNDLTLSFAFPIPIGSWTVSPSLNYMTLLDSDVRDSAGDDDDAFFAGISLSTSF
ncbi:MAG: TorF family putative porin [Planctomycetota bacterium]|jgi:uncharacterized protein (TIGR02001 family)